MIVLGIDPGARSTGIAALDTGDRLGNPAVLAHTTVEATEAELLPVAMPYLRAVLDTVADLLEAHRPSVIGLEQVVRPNPHVTARGGGGRALASSAPLLATAVVLGAVLGTDWGVDVVQVRPGGNGSHPLGEYPAELVGPRERARVGWQTRTGTGALRHARSAYDVARAAAITGVTR